MRYDDDYWEQHEDDHRLIAKIRVLIGKCDHVGWTVIRLCAVLVALNLLAVLGMDIVQDLALNIKAQVAD